VSPPSSARPRPPAPSGMRPTALAAAAAALTALAALGCATPPKPPELEAFEKLRADPGVDAAARRSPDLVTGADRLLRRAQEEWQDNEIPQARSSALMGQVKLRHALALAEEAEAKRRITAAEASTRQAQEEYARLQKELTAVNEQVGLLRRLQETSQQLSAEQQRAQEDRLRAGATDRISDAELAIKTADTVNASTHAKVPYTLAVENLTRARQELQAGSFQSAQTSAEMAKIKAEEATATAKPQYERVTQAEENKARAEALARDAASIPGVVVRREARGSLQRMVIPLESERLFTRRGTSLDAAKEGMLEPLATLLKKYPSYPVQIVGYTDNRGRTGEQLAFSLARAESVYSALVVRGVDAKRLVVSGQGSADPIADNRTATGRSRNNRIEIVFLYQ
jgi:outer membrane protein OmpA-like peptidoglycan-associated protein